MSLPAVAQIFRTKDRFLLLIHYAPDGDSIASTLALGQALRGQGRKVEIVCADAIPLAFRFLPGVATIRRDCLLGDYDVIVALDCGDVRRTGFSGRIRSWVKKEKKILINIDHHPKNDLHGLATYNYVDYQAASTSVLVYYLIRELKIPLNHRLATCLLTGLYTDTGGFKHANTTPETLSLASRFLSFGARLRDITAAVSPLSPVPRLKLWGIALSRIYHHPRLNTIATYLSHRDLIATGAAERDIGGIASLLSLIPARIVFLVVELPNQMIQIRLRTQEPALNLLPLATYFGGRGQRKAAGFTLPGRLSLAKTP